MKSVFDHIRDRLHMQAGLYTAKEKKALAIQQLADYGRTEWSDEFIYLMRNRMVMGALRYGPLLTSTPSKYNRVGSMKKRLALYEQSGNLDYLVDLANVCLCEFLERTHPKAHFEALDITPGQPALGSAEAALLDNLGKETVEGVRQSGEIGAKLREWARLLDKSAKDIHNAAVDEAASAVLAQEDSRFISSGPCCPVSITLAYTRERPRKIKSGAPHARRKSKKGKQ